jgi:hypothetical protein
MMLELNGTTNTNAALLKQRAERAERNRRLESIKMQRRRLRREKWSQSAGSLAGVRQSAETVN